MAAFPLIMVQGNLTEILFRWVPAHPPLVLNILLIPIINLFGLLVFLGYPIGTGVLIWCVYRLTLNGKRKLIHPALIVPILCNVYIVVQALPLLEIAQGSQIRPGGWAITTFLPAFAFTIYNVSYAALRLRLHESKVICVIGLLLGLLPIPVMFLSLKMILSIKGLRLERNCLPLRGSGGRAQDESTRASASRPGFFPAQAFMSSVLIVSNSGLFC